VKLHKTAVRKCQTCVHFVNRLGNIAGKSRKKTTMLLHCFAKESNSPRIHCTKRYIKQSNHVKAAINPIWRLALLSTQRQRHFNGDNSPSRMVIASSVES